MIVRKMAVLWNSTTRSYQGIHEMDGMWFVAVDLGIDYQRALDYVKEYNND